MSDCSACDALSMGLRGQLDARVLRVALDQLGPVAAPLEPVADTLELSSGQVVRAAVELLEQEHLGALLDEMA